MRSRNVLKRLAAFELRPHGGDLGLCPRPADVLRELGAARRPDLQGALIDPKRRS